MRTIIHKILLPLLILLTITSFNYTKRNRISWNIGETTCKLKLSLPKDYNSDLLEIKEGHFQTMFIKGPKNDDGYYPQLNIRTGFFPTYRFRELKFTRDQASSTLIRLFEQDFIFLTFNEPGRNTVLIEQILSLNNVKQGLKVDISLIAEDQAGAKELKEILETIKLEGASGTPTPSIIEIDPETKGIFNRHKQIVKYGTVNQHHDLISGSQYYYNSDGALSKIEIYKGGQFLRDSAFVK